MPDALLSGVALVCALLGMSWLALAMEVHWNQVHAQRRRSRTSVIALRVVGAAALLGSLLLCLAADTASMAVLVWMMLLAVSSFAVAMLLSWRPRVLALLSGA